MRTESSLSRGSDSSSESLSSWDGVEHGKEGLVEDEVDLVGAVGWSGIVIGSGVARSPRGCVAGSWNEEAVAAVLVVVGGDLGEFSIVSVDAMDAGEEGGRFLDSGSRCTFVMDCGWVMMGGGAKVGTGGAVGAL